MVLPHGKKPVHSGADKGDTFSIVRSQHCGCAAIYRNGKHVFTNSHGRLTAREIMCYVFNDNMPAEELLSKMGYETEVVLARKDFSKVACEQFPKNIKTITLAE